MALRLSEAAVFFSNALAYTHICTCDKKYWKPENQNRMCPINHRTWSVVIARQKKCGLHDHRNNYLSQLDLQNDSVS